MAGHQGARFDVLCRLIADTDLSTKPNGRDENILLFLVQTVARQTVEQRQYKPTRPRKSASRKSVPADLVDPEMPDHDLEPPRFCRKALERLLNDWSAVKAMLSSGSKSGSGSGGAVYEDQAFLASQSGKELIQQTIYYETTNNIQRHLDVSLAFRAKNNVTIRYSFPHKKVLEISLLVSK